MPTMINFVTSLLAELNAGLISADMLECGIWESGQVNHHLLAESAFIKILLDVPLSAIVTQMIGSSQALSAKVFMAVEASHSELAEMLLSWFRYFFTISSLDVSIQFTRHNFHVVFTFRASEEIREFFFEHINQ